MFNEMQRWLDNKMINFNDKLKEEDWQCTNHHLQKMLLVSVEQPACLN